MREQIPYLYLFIPDNLIIDSCDGSSDNVSGTNQLDFLKERFGCSRAFFISILRNTFELKKKSFGLQNNCFRTGIVLLSYLFLPRKSGEMLCLELC